jgi:hypothetical protein
MKAKKTSSRYDDFVERHGEDVFELEALPPEHLQRILAHTIDRVLKVDAFNAEIDFKGAQVYDASEDRQRRGSRLRRTGATRPGQPGAPDADHKDSVE